MTLYNFQYIKHGIIRRQFYGARGAPTGEAGNDPVDVGWALRADQLNYGDCRFL